jgi:carboxypeptidase C (cathepsin A)
MTIDRLIRAGLVVCLVACGAPIGVWADAAPPAAHAATAPVTASPHDSQGENSTTQPSREAGGDAKVSVTHHRIALASGLLAYTATAGRMAMKDEADKPTADMFFVAYQKDAAPAASPRSASAPATQDSSGDSQRPITFCFNGGPGAASVWLHLGAVGPQTVVLDDHGLPVGPPFKLADNADTWLASTDLVFVDPVSTGYSRAAKDQDPKQFHGAKEDVASVGDFIRLYLTKYERWGSPVYLAGESYGTTRAAALSKYLAERYGISASGIVLVSSVLDFQTLDSGGVNDLPYALFLPSYAAVAWYHHKLTAQWQADLQRTIDAARAFSTDVYLPALAKGASLDPAKRISVIAQLAAFTSLPAELIDRSDLRIDPFVFEKSVLGGGPGHQIIGRFDGRITGYDPDAVTPQPSYDPSESRYLPAYASTFNEYARRALDYKNDLPYEVLTDRVWPWNFGKNTNGYLDVLDDLQTALVENPHMRVMFVSGYFDLATPFFSADYTINRLKLPPELRANVTHVYFSAGHMVYHEAGSKRGLAQDVAHFVGQAGG